MSARAMMVGSAVASPTGCGCGGSCGCGGGCGGQCGCETRCCELECLVRPNFFCGQLLTDTDLAAMVEWTRKRFALSRYRDGWGVVCGLDLTCSPVGSATGCCGQSKKGAPVAYLTPGYAIDCCGNDLVLCEPLEIDLTSVCEPPDDPCDPNTKLPQPVDTQPAQPRQDLRDPCFDIDLTNLVAVQVSLRYHEDLAQGQRAMFRSGGCDTASCEYARVLERPCVQLEVVPLTPEKIYRQPEEQWEEDLAQALNKQLQKIRQALLGGPEEVLQYLRRYPPYRLCYIVETACCLADRDRKQYTEQVMVQLGMLLLVDWLLREMQCGCFECRPDEGVHLGAVLLRRYTQKSRTCCKVVMVDTNSRFRRPLRRHLCQPIEQGRVGLTRFIGQPAAEVTAQLREMRLSVKAIDVVGAGVKLEEFVKAADNYTFSADPATQQDLKAYVCTDPLGTARIVGFTAV